MVPRAFQKTGSSETGSPKAEEAGGGANSTAGLPAGFKFVDVEFTNDEVITIPRGWKLVSVSNHEENGQGYYQSLWFQDREGNVFMLRGITKGDHFYVFKREVARIRVKP
ncbi:MAG: hypothetical protein B9S33_13125 [Pedosphaera sp. Tous-C6FEB]|nr:MAG: hypothetical protein B9S33_13125 [Pedosphaera sp. Tous-C6FEB]